MKAAAWIASILISVPGVALVAEPAQAAATPSCASFYAYGNTTGTTHADVPTVVKSSNPNPNCLLASGNQGSAVSALQKSLKYCYVSGLSVDGVFGPATKSALITAQKKSGVTADGVYGPKTRHAMLWIYVSYSTGKPLTCGSDPVY